MSGLRQHRWAVIFAALVLYAGVTAVRFLGGSDVGEGIVLLYLLPIGLLAVYLGPLGGVAGAGVALLLFGVWVVAEDVDVGATGFLTRGAAFFLLGGLVGFLARDRTRLESTNTRWFEMSNDMLCEASLEGYFTRLNDRWEPRLGWTAKELMSRPFAELIHPDDVEPTVAATRSLAEGPSEVLDFENRYKTKDGSWRWLLWSARSDEARIYAVAKDVTERKRLEAEREDLLGRVEAIARTDQLTGLPNRRSWEEEVRQAISRAQRQRHPLAVAMIDLDSFKRFNDEQGHQAGDAVLREAGASWRMTLRVTDFIARYGGEEFAVLLPDCPPDEALGVLARLRAATPRNQTCSAGVAYWDRSESSEALVGRADAALYEAKRAGRNRVVSSG